MTEPATLIATRRHWVGTHPGAVCRDPRPGDEVTRFPRQVTCEECLAADHPEMSAETRRREHEAGDD